MPFLLLLVVAFLNVFFKGVLNVVLHAYVLCSLVPLWARAECKKAPVLIQHPRRIKNLSICLSLSQHTDSCLLTGLAISRKIKNVGNSIRGERERANEAVTEYPAYSLPNPLPLPPRWPTAKASVSRAIDLGSNPAFPEGLSPSRVILVTQTVALQSLSCHTLVL